MVDYQRNKSSYRVLEFYSGIGGMRYALQIAQTNMRMEMEFVGAFDINPLANRVYEFNFGILPNNILIECLTSEQLDSYQANVWLMSPPCQPYTMQGHRLGSKDRRASSFLSLINILPILHSPPQYIFVENVKGFEISDTRFLLVDLLLKLHYHVQEFLLSPTQFRIPNSRLRYYLLAKRSPLRFIHSELDHALHLHIPYLINLRTSTSDIPSEKDKPTFDHHQQHSDNINCFLGNEIHYDDGLVYPLGKYLEQHPLEYWKDFMIPEHIVLKYGMLFDIVFPDSHRSICFTKGYRRYCDGTGSVIQMEDKNIQGVPGNHQSLLGLKLRYFTPREIANLHGFTREKFSFPPDVTLKQCYKLLGNSVNVAVISHMLQYLFSN